jgi:hypothetical protein
MSVSEVRPRPKLTFYLKNLRLIFKLMRANRARVTAFINASHKYSAPLIPPFEGTGGPMEEGMIYIMFNSLGKFHPKSLDTAFRVFWVNSPDLRISFVDSWLISENLTSGRWARPFPLAVFKHLSKERFHQEVELRNLTMIFDGTWETGYELTFNDRKNRINGKLHFERLAKNGYIVFYGGRLAASHSMAIRAYDMFAIKVTGTLDIQGKIFKNLEGRGIIEHALGIYSSSDICDWRWMNLQFEDGIIHLFYFSVDFKQEGIVKTGEGVALMDGKWVHFPPGYFEIVELSYEQDPHLPTKIPVEWRVRAGKNFMRNPDLSLIVKKTTHLSWVGGGRKDEYVSDYILEARGSWKGAKIRGKGTMESMMHRVIK